MTELSLRESALEFLTMVVAGRVRDAYQKHAAPDLRHHNPFFSSDVDSLMNAMEEDARKNPDKVLEVQLAVQEGEHVVVFSRIRQRPDDPGGALVHIFRFEGARIVELWDIYQAVPEHSMNENGMF